MEEPFVSVIVPVYNAESTLERCLRSILNQSYRHLEVIAVNDGSRDGSLCLLRRFEKADARVRVLSQPNAGVSAARNAALAKATGTYVQFVDSDDTLVPEAIERMVHAMQSQRCDLVIGAYNEVFREQSQRRGFFKRDATLSQSTLLGKLSAHPNSFYYGVLWNKLYRLEPIRSADIRFDSRLPWGEDFAFNTQYMRYAVRTAVLARPVYNYNRNMNGLAISSAMACVAHPLYSIRVKVVLHKYYKQLYIDTGLYETYRKVLPAYLFKVTINN
ncbi:MAG: glycosyltransferase [Eubacteriales bacterium]|nr:glycosyltransferase [Eubacteriales bacterium]